MNPRHVKAPGLVWMRRRATFTPYWIACVSAWNKDPVSGVTGVQKGPL